MPLDDALRGADCAVILTAHDAYRELDPARAARLMRRPLVYDTHNMINRDAWRAAGFEVITLGRG